MGRGLLALRGLRHAGALCDSSGGFVPSGPGELLGPGPGGVLHHGLQAMALGFEGGGGGLSGALAWDSGVQWGRRRLRETGDFEIFFELWSKPELGWALRVAAPSCALLDWPRSPKVFDG